MCLKPLARARFSTPDVHNFAAAGELLRKNQLLARGQKHTSTKTMLPPLARQTLQIPGCQQHVLPTIGFSIIFARMCVKPLVRARFSPPDYHDFTAAGPSLTMPPTSGFRYIFKLEQNLSKTCKGKSNMKIVKIHWKNKVNLKV